MSVVATWSHKKRGSNICTPGRNLIIKDTNTLKDNNERWFQNCFIEEFDGRLYLRTTSAGENHIFPINTPIINGDELEWCDVEIPGYKNYYTPRREVRTITIIDSNFFNRLIREFYETSS